MVCLLSYQDMLIFPYLKRNEAKSGTADDEDIEVAVATASDVTDNPFCLLPLLLWTQHIGHGPNSYKWKPFNRTLYSFHELMKQLLSESYSTLITNNARRQDQSVIVEEQHWQLHLMHSKVLVGGPH